MTTILLLVSRPQFLKEVISSIELQECDPRQTSLLVIVDGDSTLFTETRNLVEVTKFDQKLTVQYKDKVKVRTYDIAGRRKRIAKIHNFAKSYIKEAEFIMGIEDDTVVPTDALKKLLAHFQVNRYAGLIEGVEMGRWGIPYTGAWRADDIYNPQQFKSLPLLEGLQEIDLGGFYCFMTRAENYLKHEFKSYAGNILGPDADYSLTLRRDGLKNYADFSIKCVHKQPDYNITFSNTTPRIVTITNQRGRWRQGLE